MAETISGMARSTGRCNTFWSNVGPGGKVDESKNEDAGYRRCQVDERKLRFFNE